MKSINYLFTPLLLFLTTTLFAQVQIDKPIQLTGGTGERVITNLEAPVNGTDAVNKDYVDAAVAASGGSPVSMLSDESSTDINFVAAVRYCKDLVESTYDDWRMPYFSEVMELIGKDGFSIPNDFSTNYFLCMSDYGDTNGPFVRVRLSDGVIVNTSWSSIYRARCVR